MGTSQHPAGLKWDSRVRARESRRALAWAAKLARAAADGVFYAWTRPLAAASISGSDLTTGRTDGIVRTQAQTR
jgi:hypothetical protein